MLKNRVSLIGLAIMMGLILSIMMAPSVLAARGGSEASRLNDRAAADSGKGGHGSARVQSLQQGSLVFDRVTINSMEPNTEYEIHVVVSAPGPFVGPVHPGSMQVLGTTDNGGNLKLTDIELPAVGAGTWRVDIVVTQEDAKFVPGETAESPAPPLLKFIAEFVIDRDILLACIPAFTVTIE